MSSPFFDLSGRVAIVTGQAAASASISDARWQRPAPISSSPPDTRFIARIPEGGQPGRRAVPLELDVRSHESIQRMADAAARLIGKIDILVNNAG